MGSIHGTKRAERSSLGFCSTMAQTQTLSLATATRRSTSPERRVQPVLWSCSGRGEGRGRRSSDMPPLAVGRTGTPADELTPSVDVPHYLPNERPLRVGVALPVLAVPRGKLVLDRGVLLGFGGMGTKKVTKEECELLRPLPHGRT